MNIRDVITFAGSVGQLRQELERSVEFYLETCAKHGRSPELPLRSPVR